MDDRSLKLLTMHYIRGLSTHEKLLFVELLDTADDVRKLTQRECEIIIGRTIRLSRFDPIAAYNRAEGDIHDLTARGFGYNFYWDFAYPALLREIHDPPFLFFYRGTNPCSSSATAVAPWIAVVGTRFPTGNGRKTAYALGREFADLGVPVVSGLAYGIDEAVHVGVVDGKGIAIAVLGNGIDTVYPKENARLARKIVEKGGCLVSEYGPGIEPRRYHFPARNRIIAGCCRGTLVVEAPRRSGALITADFALEDGRDLFVHRAGTAGANANGCAALAEDGARLVDSGLDILREWDFGLDGEAAMLETSNGMISS